MIIPDCTITTDPQGRELLTHGNIAFPIAIYHDNLATHGCSWHWHNELELFIVTEGAVSASAGTEKYILHKGEGLFCNATVLHEVSSIVSEPCYLHSIVFHPRLVGGSIDSIYWQNYLHPLLSDLSLPGVALSPDVPWNAELLSCIEVVWHACKNEAPGYEFFVREQLSKAVFLINANCSVPNRKPNTKTLRDGIRIKQMLQFIHAHYQDSITITQIAESAMISESEALRCFRSMLNTTPIQYVKQYRLECASRLLTSTDEKIVTIGIKCGFQEMSYFARSFHEKYGCTPSDYRQSRLSANAQSKQALSD